MGRNRRSKTASDIKISGIADKGMSVGRDPEGTVYFLQGGVPGDTVDAVITKKKKGVPFGFVKEIKEYSPDRVDPFCEHFGVCGGCKWQHLDYKIQVEQKEKQVRDSIRRIAKVEAGEFLPILQNEKLSFYRNKLEYSFSNKRWITEEEVASGKEIIQTKALGFHRPGVFDKIVDIETCHLQNDSSNKIRNFIRDLTAEKEFGYYDIRANKGFLREMVVRSNRDGKIMLILIFGKREKEKINYITEKLIETFPEIVSLFHIINTKMNSSFYDLEPEHIHGEEYLTERLGEVEFKIGPKSFFQTNTLQAENLFKIARDFADIQPEDNVYDLYTGLGSIALFVADQCKSIVGIEEIEEAIDLARINADHNNITNSTFYAGDVKDLLTDAFVEKHGKADIIITDPPRMGMHPEVVEMFLKLETPKIVYISCNPATQARDIGILSEKYTLEKIQPVDMFPHTHHVESVALLKLK
ncbi:23S rRNA (uracil(1939)-C(5))-methyltransferase RlmD [Portibacter lacus]|uniref:23S rRNA (Uracil-5-)-methyltransferase RumA n=1 Tax=Portibacter lacus TaxID=1099794 RepID=A0AA37SUC4_9BACT|nr:23S rRNA (uracil(1939)-C(5))-methyltransferase RlmD [Portibacter lacus]GLR18936.1 23S rRNA (uracil-5-)-methyltransferase RumA [Portibacter lacus]